MWCVRPTNEHQDESHASAVVACNPGGDEPALVSVQLHRFWEPDEGWIIGLNMTQDDERHWYALPQVQALSLYDALGRLIALG
jgi:hypothetical protein